MVHSHDLKHACLALMLCLLTLAGCIEHGEKRRDTAPRQPQRLTVSGDVFIVTRSGESVKLGLVTVSAIPESAVVAHIAGRRAIAEQQLASLESDRAQIRSRIAAADNQGAAATARLSQMPWPKGNNDVAGHAAREREHEIERSASKAAAVARGQLASLDSQANYLQSPSFYFEDLPAAVASAKTDADGRFTIQLSVGKRVALLARSQRELVGGTETYSWMLWLVPNEGQVQRIFLSNDNLLIGAPDVARLPVAGI